MDSEASDMTHWFTKTGINIRKQVPEETIGNKNSLSSGKHENWPSSGSQGILLDGTNIVFPECVLASIWHDITHLQRCVLPGEPPALLDPSSSKPTMSMRRREAKENTMLTGFLVIDPG